MNAARLGSLSPTAVSDDSDGGPSSPVTASRLLRRSVIYNVSGASPGESAASGASPLRHHSGTKRQAATTSVDVGGSSVHFNIDAMSPSSHQRYGNLAKQDQQQSILFHEVQRLLSTTRADGGLGGRLAFRDMDWVLAHFRVDVYTVDTIDDVWVTLCAVAGFRQPPPFISDSAAIACVFEQYGGRLPQQRRNRSVTPPANPRVRCMSPTVSSARKHGSNSSNNANKTKAATSHSPAAAVGMYSKRPVRGTSPTVFDRLNHDALIAKQRHQEQHQAHMLSREQEVLEECTFAPTIGRSHRHSGTASSSLAAASSSSMGNNKVASYVGPTQSSLMRTTPVVPSTSQVPNSNHDDIDPYLPSASARRQRSQPSFIPQQVPVGYVEAVSRLRQAAIERTHKHFTFEESLRNPTLAAAVETEAVKKLQSGTILRITVPTLGETVNVRLAASSSTGGISAAAAHRPLSTTAASRLSRH